MVSSTEADELPKGADPVSPAERWSRRALWALIWPLAIEQLLAVTIGMADTLMVATAGEAAVSGISLVDQINILLINLFSALATGGAVVVSQYIGRRDNRNAAKAACQLVLSITVVSLLVMTFTLFARLPLLQLIFGRIDADVMTNAELYFLLSALSYPFLGLYNAGAALFRSMGNSKISMFTSIIINVINIGGNSLLIYGLGWGVAGAGTATLVSRMVAAIVVIWLLMKPNAGPANLRRLFRSKLDFSIIRSILRIGVPNGLENSVFQIGKLITARIISSLGTAAIAGNAMAGILASFSNLPGNAISLSLLTVVGQCVGSKDYAAARKYTKFLMRICMASIGVISIIMLLVGRPVLALFNLSAEAQRIAWQCLAFFNLFGWLFWPYSFALPNALRAAGDAKYTLTVSLFSMWLFRIGSAYLLAYTFQLGVLGVWGAMFIDWIVRSCFFALRWRSTKWETKRIISE